MAPELTVGLVALGDPRDWLRSAATVLHQSWPGTMRLKIVADGDPGETSRRIECLGAAESMIEVLRGRPGSTAEARNRILRNTATRYLAWIDAGDLWHPQKLELQFSALESSGTRAAIVACRAYTRGKPSAVAAAPGGTIGLPKIVRAPFSTLLGTTHAFKVAAELDERLVLLADDEFQVRLALAGSMPVRLTDAPELCALAPRTGIDLSAWDDEAATIFRRHGRALAGRFGRRAALAYRAELAERAGTGTGTGTDAGAAGEPRARYRVAPSAWTRNALLAASLGSLRRHAARALHTARARSIPFARRIGARLLAADALEPTHPAVIACVGFATGSRSAGLASVAPGLAAMTAAGESAGPLQCRGAAELTAAERSVLTIAHACCAAGKLARAQALLESQLDSGRPSSGAHPRLIERLATVHLTAGRPEQSQALLTAALCTHPDDDALLLALADTFVRTGKWEQAVAQWERLSPAGKAAASAGIKARVARAYRLIGRPRDALAIASEAAATARPDRNNAAPMDSNLDDSILDDDVLGREIDKCRRLCAGWPECLVPIDGRADGAAGRVEAWGFLAGGRDPLKGRLTVDTHAAPQVTADAHAAPQVTAASHAEPQTENAHGALEVRLCINGMPIAATRALTAAGTTDFAINCADVLYYLGDGDIVEVTTERGRLELPAGGVAAMVHNGLSSRVGVLKRKLDQGHVFTKLGALASGRTEESKRATLDFYCEVAELLESHAGVFVSPFYGNLLGAVRENDFIAHDADGFDMWVLCRSHSPSAVKTELAEICALLRERGYALEVMPWCVYVRRPESTQEGLLDLSYGWFTESDELNVSFGWRYAPVRGRTALTKDRRCRLTDRDVRVPGNAEAVLEQLYGSAWRVPDQGFSSHAGLRRDERYLLSESDIATMLGAPRGADETNHLAAQ